MSVLTVVLFLAGLGLLVGGAELLVRGASRLAAALGVSPLIIGLTIVAFGTSAPELAVSVGASLAGQPDIALGNVVGSNIFNVLLILGLSALIVPVAIARQLMRFDIPVMVAVSLLVAFVGRDGVINRIEGMFLFLGILAYTAFLAWAARRERANVKEEYARAVRAAPERTWASGLKSTAMALAGLGVLTLGARWLVNSTVEVATALGVSKLVLGLTVVAAGTSLPELATSVVASIRGERDLAVGNIVGSNIFNILAVLGLGAVVASHGVPVSKGALHFDIPVMIAVALACLPVFFTGHTISRWEGALFVGYYAAYTTYLIMEVAIRNALPTFTWAMRGFAIPLTTVVLGFSLGRAVFRKSRPLY